MNRIELQNEIVKKVMSNQDFRSEIMKDPKAAISKAFNITIPQNMKINIIEEDADIVSLVIPKMSSELSDSELDNVSGGGCGINCYCSWDIF